MRLTLYLNLFMAALTIGVAIFTITIKSHIAVDQRAIARLNTQIDTEQELAEVLAAEWARLQRRDMIEALGIARFGEAVGQTAQVINVRDLPPRPELDAGADTNASGRIMAYRLFRLSVAQVYDDSPNTPLDQTDPSQELNPSDRRLSDPDPIGHLIRQGQTVGQSSSQPSSQPAQDSGS